MSQDYAMHAEGIYPRFSFKAIDIETSSASDSYDDELVSPTNIFRDASNSHNDPISVSPLQLANPVHEQHDSSENYDSVRVISPYPFSHASQEEIEEREQLTGTLDWSMHPEDTGDSSITEEHIHAGEYCVNYSLYFQSGAQQMDCDDDDFSVSSHEANSIEDDLCLENISEDPASFWKDDHDLPCLEQRIRMPSQVILVTNDEPLRPIMSVGKVPRRRPALSIR
jgi:hypothetical protein